MQNLGRADALLKAMHDRGIRRLRDDFGSGHSSLSNLCRLPPHAVKIDHRLESDLPGETRAKGIVAAVIAMGHQLDLKVIAEGMKTGQHGRFPKAEGCDSAQGFLRGRLE